jgi:indole-3-glycerol phosphate synthase
VFLDEVIATSRMRCAAFPAERSLEMCPPTRSLHKAIRACAGRRAIIAEIKPASPTNGRFRHIDDLGTMAGELAGAGACALSVLTEPVFFGGSPDSLGRVRETVEIPILRKDFIVDERQLTETRALGGDAVLLIARVLGDRLSTFVDLAWGLGLEPLVEVQTEREAELALATDTALIGINNRDLGSLRIDLSTTARIAPRLREADATVVSMSGVISAADIHRLAPDCDAFLIGSFLMRAPSPGRALEELVAA